MTVMLVLAALAVLVVIGCIGSAVIALVIGAGAVSFRQTRWAAPVFLLIVPLAALGALAGCFGLGAYFIRLNEHLLLWGPVLGLLIGGSAGGVLGLVISTIIWWRAFRRFKQNASGPAPA